MPYVAPVFQIICSCNKGIVSRSHFDANDIAAEFIIDWLEKSCGQEFEFLNDSNQTVINIIHPGKDVLLELIKDLADLPATRDYVPAFEELYCCEDTGAIGIAIVGFEEVDDESEVDDE